ncbi:MAG: glyoxylate/hydroxypyruvate reductase A [Pseudomonadota bacterium]
MALLIIGSDRAQDFHKTALAKSPERDVRLWPDVGEVGDIRHALAWHPDPGVLKTFPNLETIVSVGAGVDHLFKDPDLPSVPIIRYIDPDLTGRMVEYVTLQTLYHTRRMSEYRAQQTRSNWQYLPEPAAHEVRVGIMGLGVLGAACAQALLALGYQVRGWTRSPRQVEGVTCFAGQTELDPFLAETDILVVLLPFTPDTKGLIDRGLLRKLSATGRHARMPGPVLINAGRGGVQVGDDILAALDAGELYAASLDVFEVEPLPADSPFWANERVVITPHNAAESTPDSIVTYFLDHVARMENGEAMQNVVDRDAGY